MSNKEFEIAFAEDVDWQSPERENPLVLFRKHYEHVSDEEELFPNAACLATVDEQLQPSSRIILIKEINRDGLVFYTNYESRKGRQLANNPRASLTIFWPAHRIQVRIEGGVEKTSSEKSNAYFQSRPRESQLGAWASAQSTTINSREELEKRFNKLAADYDNQPIPIPDYWGGMLLRPQRMEFWYSRESRLHDRILYCLRDNRWVISRLAP